MAGRLCSRVGIKVHLSNPLKTRAIAEAKIKTDKVDAKEVRQLRYFLRFRLCLNRYRTSLKNRIHSLLDFKGIRPPTVSDLFGVRGRQFLNSLHLNNGYQEALNVYLKILDEVESRIKVVTKKLSLDVKQSPDSLRLQSMPGIGILLSQLIVAEIGEISRFAAPEKLCAYAGLVPGLHQSGQTLYHTPCSNQGNKFLRWAMIEAAQVAARKDPFMKAFYDRIYCKKGSQKATIAVARKLLVIVFQILTKKENSQYAVAPRQARQCA